MAIKKSELYSSLWSRYNLLRGGTSIGVMMREAEHAESKPGLAHKTNSHSKKRT